MLDHPLYQSILAEPNADAPRLIMADWLDEMGNPYADFIRAQVALASPETTVKQASRLLLQERALLNQHKDFWMAKVHEVLQRETSLRIGRQNEIREVGFLRGFIGYIRMRAADWVGTHQRLQQFFPIENLCLIGANTHLRQDRSPELIRNIRQLSIHSTQNLRLEDLQPLFERDDLKNLENIRLVNIQVYPYFADRIIYGALNEQTQIVFENCYMQPSVTSSLTDRFGHRVVFNNQEHVDQWIRANADRPTVASVVRQQSVGLAQVFRRWVSGRS